MRGGRRYLALLVAVSTLLFPPCCANGGSGETRAQFNGSAAAFDSFRAQFRRVYAADGEEFKRRRLIFQDATKRHAYLNSFSTAPQSAKYGVNRFSDLSQHEFRDLYLRASPDRAPPFSGLKTEGLPDRFDWRDKAVVAPVQNQEASRVKLVPQSEYPYKATTGVCHFFSPSHGGVALRNFTEHDFSGQEEAMMGHLVERGPLAVIVDAVSWQDYLGGIIQHHCSSQWANHAVLLVGYSTVGDIPYWIVQNSWGASWGNEGYVYIKIGGNLCGIADSVAAVFL